jgi:hypothetical protein
MYKEAEYALTGAKRMKTDHLNIETNKQIPNGASGFYYLGFVCER